MFEDEAAMDVDQHFVDSMVFQEEKYHIPKARYSSGLDYALQQTMSGSFECKPATNQQQQAIVIPVPRFTQEIVLDIGMLEEEDDRAEVCTKQKDVKPKKGHYGRGYNYPVLDSTPEQLIVTKRSIFRCFKRYIRQHANSTKTLQTPKSKDSNYFTRALTATSSEWEPEKTKAILPDLEENFADLLGAIKKVHVDQCNKAPIVSIEGVEELVKLQSQQENYLHTIADLCYRYNKFSKERMLHNTFLTFTFICYSIWKLQQLELQEGVNETIG